MEPTTIIGIVLAFVAVVGGSVLHGTGVAALWNEASFAIVIIGTVAAISVQTPLTTLLQGVKLIPWAFKPPVEDASKTLAEIVEWSQTARKQGLLALEAIAEAQLDEFRKKGLQLLVDGTEAQTLRGILETEISQREQHDLKGAKVFEGMGIYAPTLGITGAVLGLISVMRHLADPNELGHGIAAAFTATIYGVASANLFFLPLSNKLKGVIQKQAHSRELFVEGLVSIARGDNPRNIEARLSAYLQ